MTLILTHVLTDVKGNLKEGHLPVALLVYELANRRARGRKRKNEEWVLRPTKPFTHTSPED
jgi:hypothetical protein